MDGQSQGVFQGKIIVEPGAQKTNSKMMSRALLLSETAEFANKPELEIFADDVVCGHGATCGRIDKQMLFFLRSRGIGKAEARADAGAGLPRRRDRADRRRGDRRRRSRRARAAGSAWRRRRPDARTNGAYDVEKIRADFPILSRTSLRQAARLSRQRRLGAEAARRARPHPARLHGRIRQRPSRPALPRQRRDRGLRGCARDGPPLHQRAVGRGDHLHPLLDRGDQPRRAVLRRHADRGGRRDRALHPRAPFQHRALALPPRAARRGDQMGADPRRRRVRSRGLREAPDRAHEDGRDRPHVERHRHGRADQGGLPHRA